MSNEPVIGSDGELVTLTYGLTEWPPRLKTLIAVLESVQTFWELVWSVGTEMGELSGEPEEIRIDPAMFSSVDDGKNELRFTFRAPKS